MEYKNCPEKEILKERITRLEDVSNMKDEENERAITGLTNKMNNFMEKTAQEINEIKTEIKDLKEELPTIFKKELEKSFDSFLLRIVKKSFKWIFGIVIAGIGIFFKSEIISFIKGLFIGV